VDMEAGLRDLVAWWRRERVMGGQAA
jgi:hypothetical protein